MKPSKVLTRIENFIRLALRRLLLVLLLVLPIAAHAAAPADKVALIIANSKYDKAAPLANPLLDARLVADALKTVGFTSVTVVQNVDREKMRRAVSDFGLLADKADVAVIYYAGHGMEVNGTNYLLPVDVQLARDRDVELEAVKLDTLVQMTEGARRLRIVILDACRNNPFDAVMVRQVGSRAVSRGLAPVEPVGESLVVYAAKAGKTAADGSGGNSPFARALARRLVEPGNEVNLLFRKVRDDVLAETAGQQEPFTYGSLSSREFYFRAPVAHAGAVAGVVDLEAEAWDLCKNSRSRSPCEGYLASHAKGKFSALARAKLADISSVAAPPVATLAVSPIVSESIRALGLSVRSSDDRSGILVQSISEDGPAFGQLLPGDLIVGINSAQIQRGVSPTSQLGGALATGRVKLLVKRGAATSVVILRAGQGTARLQ